MTRQKIETLVCQSFFEKKYTRVEQALKRNNYQLAGQNLLPVLSKKADLTFPVTNIS